MVVRGVQAVLGVAFISTVVIGCTPASVGGEPEVAQATSKVTSALASTESQLKLGITRWHSTIEKGSDGSKAATVDGQDSSGTVKFLATIREDSDTSTVHIQSVLPNKGELIFSDAQMATTTNTLPTSLESYAAAFETDWQTAYPANVLLTTTSATSSTTGAAATSTTGAAAATTTTGHKASLHAGAKGGSGGSASSFSPGIDGNDALAGGINNGLIAIGHYYGAITDKTYDAYNDDPDYDPANYDANGKRIDQSAQDKAQDAQQDKDDQQAADDKAQDQQQDADDQQAADDKAQDAQQDSDDQQAADDKAQDDQQDADDEQDAEQDQDDLPASNGGNLDDMGTTQTGNQSTQQNNGDFGDVGDFGGDDQGSDFGGGGFDDSLAGSSTLAPDAKAAPTNRCTEAATSKSTGVRACVKFDGR